MEPIRLGILASGSGTTYQSIQNVISAGELDAYLEVVISDKEDAAVLERAYVDGIPHHWINRKLYPKSAEGSARENFDRAIADTLHAYDVDLVVFAGWMRVCTGVLIEAFNGNIINVHPSLLPSFKGMDAPQQALDAGVKIAGCTVHWVTEELDGGPIIVQRAEPVKPGDTAKSLHNRIKPKEQAALLEALQLIIKQRYANGGLNGK